MQLSSTDLLLVHETGNGRKADLQSGATFSHALGERYSSPAAKQSRWEEDFLGSEVKLDQSLRTPSAGKRHQRRKASKN